MEHTRPHRRRGRCLSCSLKGPLSPGVPSPSSTRFARLYAIERVVAHTFRIFSARPPPPVPALPLSLTTNTAARVPRPHHPSRSRAWLGSVDPSAPSSSLRSSPRRLALRPRPLAGHARTPSPPRPVLATTRLTGSPSTRAPRPRCRQSSPHWGPSLLRETLLLPTSSTRIRLPTFLLPHLCVLHVQHLQCAASSTSSVTMSSTFHLLLCHLWPKVPSTRTPVMARVAPAVSTHRVRSSLSATCRILLRHPRSNRRVHCWRAGPSQLVLLRCGLPRLAPHSRRVPPCRR